MSNDYTPAQVVIRTFGSHEAAGHAVGLGSKAAFVWLKPAKGRKAGDLPSSRIIRKFLDASKKIGRPLTLDHLIYGAQQSEIDALIEASIKVDPQPETKAA